MLSPANSLAAANLAIFIILLPPTLYNLVRHGGQGFLGWLYLFAFAILRITGSGLQLSSSDLQTAEVINGVGLSPLVLAVLGVLHECSHYIRLQFSMNISPVVVTGDGGGHSPGKENKPFVLGWVPYILVHLLAGLAIALVVIGATKTPPELGKERGGYFVFLIVWVVLGLFVGLAWRAKSRCGGIRDANLLLYALTISLPFLFIRIVYALAASFDSSISPETGPIGYRVVLQALMEFIISIGLVVSGLITRNIRRNARAAQNPSGNMGGISLQPREGVPGTTYET